MALCRLTLRIRPTVTHIRYVHTSGSGKSQQEAAADVESEPQTFSVLKTMESDPAHHSKKHLNHFYTVPPDVTQLLFSHSFPARFQQQVKTFNEACIMVRSPALELISYLKQTDFSKPALRYLFYGYRGSGKSMSLCHAVHFCHTQGWVVLHVPDAHIWVKNCKELLPSSYKASRLDQPQQAVTWLRNFKTTNEAFLSQIKTTQRYVWTKRESTEEGSLLGELVDQGISRMKSSSDVVGALMKELRLQSGRPDASFRLAVAVDSVNALWGTTTLKKMDRSPVDPDELTLIYNLKKLVKNDWRGGVIITALSKTGSVHTPRDAYLPQVLLGEKGFDSMDPFIPISVSHYYTEEEYENCYLYYLERKWLQLPQCQTEAGRKELVFLSCRNPAVFEKMCASL